MCDVLMLMAAAAAAAAVRNHLIIMIIVPGMPPRVCLCRGGTLCARSLCGTNACCGIGFYVCNLEGL